MPTYLSTPTANYALGRNTTLTLTFLAPVGSASYTSVTMEICISQGQVSMDTDTIEIASNCQSGWKVKLPGLISGTVTGTGYVASSNVTSTGNALSLRTDPINLLQFLGQPAAVTISAETNIVVSNTLDNDFPFDLAPPSANPINGFFKSSNVSISPDDAVKMDFTIELSGAQNLIGFVALSQAVTTA